MRKIILIGALPPPFDGQSVAFKILYDSILKSGMESKAINISSSNIFKNKRYNTLNRVIDYFVVIIKLIYHCIGTKNLIYLQTSQTKKGFLRDRIIVSVAKIFRSKIIGHLHGGNFDGFYNNLDDSGQAAIRKELKKYDKLIVLSENLIDMYNMQPLIHHRIMSIPNGTGKKVDPKVKKSIGILSPKNPLRILYLSNLIESKGYLVVLELSRLLKQMQIPFVVDYCGRFSVSNDNLTYQSNEEAEADFFKKIKAYKLENEIRFNGVVTGKEKEHYLENAHFFILPTNYINEGQPISIIEAMRAGCNIITTHYRAIPEMITHYKSGFLLHDRKPESILQIIMDCISNPELFESISLKAQEEYNNRFTEVEHCENLISILKINSFV